MRRLFDVAVERARHLTSAVAQMVVVLRARRQLWIAAVAAGVLCVGVTGAAAYGAWCWLGGGSPVQQGEDGWRYLLVCGGCQHRERTSEHPSLKLAQKEGLLRCPKCGQFKANWYRRGAQALPPGGW